MINNKDKENILKYFEEYSHNIPVIYSHLEGQYQGELIFDNEQNPQVVILFTPFDFHYIAGNAEMDDVVNVVEKMIFKKYLSRNNKKEAIVFGPSKKWNQVLDQVFKRHQGIIDSRMIFKLNMEKYQNQLNDRQINDKLDYKLLFEKEQDSQLKYPIARVYVEDQSVSFCSGFMLGKGHAEINVETLETYRGNGYAKEAAFTLIDYLLESSIEPDWCAWPFRKASHQLAISLGYELSEEIPAYIWVEEECGKIKI